MPAHQKWRKSIGAQVFGCKRLSEYWRSGGAWFRLAHEIRKVTVKAIGARETKAHIEEECVRHLIGNLTVAACAAIIALPAQAQTVTSHNISFELAKRIAEAAMTDCEARGGTVAVHVVDGSGNIVVSYRADHSRPHIYQVAYEKAFTAMSFQRSSGELEADLVNGNIARTQQADFPNMVLLGGGLPIVINDETVGGVGVAGLPGAQSEQCAQAGIDAVLN